MRLAISEDCNISQPTHTDTHICYTLHWAERFNLKQLHNLSDSYQKGSHNYQSYVLAKMEKSITVQSM